MKWTGIVCRSASESYEPFFKTKQNKKEVYKLQSSSRHHWTTCNSYDWTIHSGFKAPYAVLLSDVFRYGLLNLILTSLFLSLPYLFYLLIVDADGSFLTCSHTREDSSVRGIGPLRELYLYKTARDMLGN
jgi:hypothetical protein